MAMNVRKTQLVISIIQTGTLGFSPLHAFPRAQDYKSKYYAHKSTSHVFRPYFRGGFFSLLKLTCLFLTQRSPTY